MSAPSRRSFLKGASATVAAAIAIEPTLYASPPKFSAPMRVGLIGAGRQGRAILGELAQFEEVTVAGICDTVKGRLRSAKRRAPDAEPTADWQALLALPDLDAVIVSTPTHLHREIAIAALEAGKHVYCEAPLAHTIEDAHAIAIAARSAKGVFCSGLQGRSDPVYKLARSFVRSGAIRDLVSLRAQFRKKTSWVTPASDPKDEAALNWRLNKDTSTGLAGEFGTHQFDVLHWFTGVYPVEANGRGGVLAYKDGREVADTIHCHLGFESGMNLAYEATLSNSFEGTHELIIGTMGAVKLAWTHGWMFKEADAATQGWEVYANRQRFHNDEGVTLIAEATKLAEQGKLKDGVGLPNSPLYYALESFMKSAIEGEPVACSAEEGMRATVVGITANEAIKSRSTVKIDPDTMKVG
ncbi:MAG: putative dehydrogenase [Planctomycetota bacterium]|jgi:predicted dehydrogenase